jgi:hypothetical protein
MKTFESQLLELLREYDKDLSIKNKLVANFIKEPMSLYGFMNWISIRVEKKEEKIILECNHTVDLSQFTQYGEHCYSVCRECKKVFEVDMVKFLKEAL